MTTPNIEELRKLADETSQETREWFELDAKGWCIAGEGYDAQEYIAAANPATVIALLDQLQSQAERIATLEDDVESLQKNIDTTCSSAAELIAKCFAERDALRAELAAIAAVEPVAKLKPCKEGWFIDLDNPPPITGGTIELLTRPMPAQGVAELVEAFEYHIEQTRPIERSTIALFKYKGAK